LALVLQLAIQVQTSTESISATYLFFSSITAWTWRLL